MNTVLPNDQAPATPATDQCDVCPHPWSAHDALGVRFCTATAAAALSRGCVCR
ncbi:RGCVC family protein [Actinosynnema sp. NPDC020468]|uniref:RGCVC family protein n=1 Tax=Actinosynnema sp. NPDC020468 TaxID=3154488 RepID=UPI0033ED2EAF